MKNIKLLTYKDGYNAGYRVGLQDAFIRINAKHLIFCKDCMYSNLYLTGLGCDRVGVMVKEYGFCAWAERKDDSINDNKRID